MAVFVAATALRSFSQISLEIQLDQKQFLCNESIPIRVRLLNRTGQPLRIGEVPDWLSFTVESRDGKLIQPSATIVAGGNFELDSAESVTKLIDLTAGYDFIQPGSFRVTALARFPRFGLTASSSTQPFDVVRGTQLWQEICGAPTTNGKPRLISYSLLQVNHLRQLRCYVRIADSPETGFARVLPLGNIVAFAKPEQRIDRSSSLHVLFQTGPRTVDYCQISPAGEMLQKQVYSFTSQRPRLSVDQDGQVGVKGGNLPVVFTGRSTNESSATRSTPQTPAVGKQK